MKQVFTTIENRLFTARTRFWRIMPGVVMTAILITMGSLIPFADDDHEREHGDRNPRIFPPNSAPYGLTYGEWSAKWWQLVFSIPAPNNPLLHDDKCEFGQSGRVWFLTGKLCTDTSSGCSFVTATRHCTVPAGKALFFPIANSEADNLGVDPPLDLESLRAAAKSNQNTVTNMTCEIDGVPVIGLDPPQTSPYRVLSPVFSYTIPENNIYQALGLPFGAQTVSPAVGDGVFLMLKPLHVGQHLIHLTANFAGGFGFDITYHLDVVPWKNGHDE
jgi:hypothetical protein